MPLRVNEHCILENLPLDAIYLASEELDIFQNKFEYDAYFYSEIGKLIDQVEKVGKDFQYLLSMLENDDDDDDDDDDEEEEEEGVTRNGNFNS